MKFDDLVQNMPSIQEYDNVCDVCQYGKQNKLSFLSEASRRAMKN